MPEALGICSPLYWNWEEDITILPGFVPSEIGLPVENLIRGSIVLILCITLLTPVAHTLSEEISGPES